MMHYLMHPTPRNTPKCTETPISQTSDTEPEIDRTHQKSTTYKKNKPLAGIYSPDDGLDAHTARNRINTRIFCNASDNDAQIDARRNLNLAASASSLLVIPGSVPTLRGPRLASYQSMRQVLLR
jgi:hypothetical protein